jgi:hypothetical protein
VQVRRQRRSTTTATARGRFSLVPRSRPARLVLVGLAALAVAGTGAANASTVVFHHHQVGDTSSLGLQVSADQAINPVGQRLVTKYGKFIGSAVSPDGRFLAASTADSGVVLQIFDLEAQRPIWLVGSTVGVNTKLDDRSVGQEGPTYSPDGKFLWLPQTNGYTRFEVKPDGTLGVATTIPLAQKPITPVQSTGALPLSSLSALPGKAAFSPDGATTVF